MFISRSPDETRDFGATFAGRAERGSVIALMGDLGAGKTQFVKGLVTGLGSCAEVSSPTFALLHEYKGGRLPVYHFDFYRLENAQAASAIGLDEYLFGDGVCAIEWADKFSQLLPADCIRLKFEAPQENERTIREELKP